ncbi:PEP-CTERM sorting domain-containing protein [Nostoc sp. MS1]|uniref:PEP-CTERM sorting domain-containing protein n=1 Tax=Nostoc sp. MS1 TaxID=2764711 RepID=UPI001CC72C04|nr:PEP-CTERM sorting domain-containing protein [Nostoc sp. MS1]BCL35481.1 hypothetical protein NSMS1_19280 [Nostoc sp. MS1]
MFGSRSGWLVPVTLTLFGLGTNLQSAKAENTNNYQFSVDYYTSVKLNFDYRPDLNIVRANITGDSTTPAPYGLDFFTSNTYGQLQPSDPPIIKYKFNSDPSVFGLLNEPKLFDVYYGNGENKLFGRASDSAEINPSEGTIRGGGTITIYDGEGIFKNATGTINFTQEDPFDPTGSSRGLAKLNFNLQTPREVPEPTTATTLIGIGVVAASLRIRKHYTQKLKVPTI